MCKNAKCLIVIIQCMLLMIMMTIFFFLSEKRERNCAQKFQIRDPFGRENTLLIKERFC